MTEQLKMQLGKGTYSRPFRVKETETSFVVIDRRGAKLCAIQKPRTYVYPLETEEVRADKAAKDLGASHLKRASAEFIVACLNDSDLKTTRI